MSPTSIKDSLLHDCFGMTLLKKHNARDGTMTAIGPSSGVGKRVNKKGEWDSFFGVMGMVYILIVVVVQNYI